ncbi:asparagine synthase (glutamine-hydrolyzing) [Neolewinella litorea]|uniref:asparagine synthase (glutamine-hydrolyzing) n=1 Tax=Neolewinella litorea TaxID=2562452 RepID=A0A4S4N899_9BACT|nr:asparagine synthase (glutamine-hydrolyzing) [Neolewinella litorea]THH34567.1 asparagine synthase (glutamine-hydrolyzing) [Neolewinella litorea]
MCGIFGVFNQSASKRIDRFAAKRAIDAIAHRGPDAEGIQFWDDQLCLGHRRLSIIDLHVESNQPFKYEHLSITYNGEIFNYKELKSELLQAGHSFRTASDTEVILVAYLHWGPECVKRFNGMWAFAIYDANDDSLFCSRDRFGIKPFNYSFKDGRFVFASEIKSMIAFDSKAFRRVNYGAISRYCRETIGAQSKETWFEDVYRLPPAHNLIVCRDSHKFDRYWEYPTEELQIDYETAKEQYRHLFKTAVELRLRSDVPVGLTLSGGVDSASIACQIYNEQAVGFNTYTASFPGHGFDEYPIAASLSRQLGMNSIEVQLDYSNYVTDLTDIIYHLESGHGSPAIFPLWHITKRAKRDITVFLEGQGADELLGGYVNSIFVDHFIGLIRAGKFNQALAEVNTSRSVWGTKQLLMLYLRQNLPPYWRKKYRQWSGLENIYQNELNRHDAYEFKNENHVTAGCLNRRLKMQHQTGLVNLLHYGDAISMAHSLENRLPFLDFRLVEFVFSLPASFKVDGAIGKKIHRDVMRKSVPAAILDNPKKLGFVSPLKQVFAKGTEAVDVVLSRQSDHPDIFNNDQLICMINEHQSNSANHERILFKILNTKLWFNHFGG